jgi:hypothetical protein
VWLLSIPDIPNLKIAGSSPAFGYSYTKQLTISFCLHHVVVVGKSKRVGGGGEKFWFFGGEAWAWRTGLASGMEIYRTCALR